VMGAAHRLSGGCGDTEISSSLGGVQTELDALKRLGRPAIRWLARKELNCHDERKLSWHVRRVPRGGVAFDVGADVYNVWSTKNPVFTIAQMQAWRP
jgi:hypothetical protein